MSKKAKKNYNARKQQNININHQKNNNLPYLKIETKISNKTKDLNDENIKKKKIENFTAMLSGNESLTYSWTNSELLDSQ